MLVYVWSGLQEKREEGTLEELLKSIWGKNGIVHWAEGMPVLLVLRGN